MFISHLIHDKQNSRHLCLPDRIKFRISIITVALKEGDHGNWVAVLAWTKDLNSLLNLK